LVGLQPLGQHLRCLRIAQPRVRRGPIWATRSDLRCNPVRLGRPLGQPPEISVRELVAEIGRARVVAFVHRALVAPTFPTVESIFPMAAIGPARAIGPASATVPLSGISPNQPPVLSGL